MAETTTPRESLHTSYLRRALGSCKGPFGGLLQSGHIRGSAANQGKILFIHAKVGGGIQTTHTARNFVTSVALPAKQTLGTVTVVIAII